MLLIFSIVLLVILSFLYYLLKSYKHSLETKEISHLLQATALNLIRNMENNPTTTPKKYASGNKQDYEEVFINNITRIQPMLPPSIFIGALPAPITQVPGAMKTLEDNRTFNKSFWFVAQGIRNGIQAFLFLFNFENIDASYLKIIEHMKRQRDEYEQKGTQRSPNFTELKMVFGLPTNWPKGELPERLERKSLPTMRAWLIRMALRHYREEILHKLTYKPYTLQGEPPEFYGEDVLEGMREYIR